MTCLRGKRYGILSNMETNFTPELDSEDTKSNERLEVVKHLQEDRQRIAERTLLPPWFHPALGAVAATYVGAPALPDSGEQNSGYIFALVATLILIYVTQRKTGIRLGNGGVKGQLAAWSMLIVVLAGFIVTLGLVSSGLNWWAAIPALVVFTAILLLSKFYEKSVRSQINHGR
jgi:hypothetical protein